MTCKFTFTRWRPATIQWLSFIPLFLLCMLSAQHLQAQTLSGKVFDSKTNEPLVGVGITEEGTRNGTVTDLDGKYTLRISKFPARLIFSFVGYKSESRTVNAGQPSLDVAMNEGAQLSELVVTALGIRKEAKKLGYSVTQLSGESLTQAREVNVANSLVGKVAGVNVSGVATGPAGSSRVTIRGNTSISGDNQPLYVVNGVPLDNSNLGSAGKWGGADYGDGISSINPDDIESISVLKGATAAALYGYRAKNGAIMITTKGGKDRKGVGVELNSNWVWEQPQILYDWQREYGQGDRGLKPADVDAARVTGLLSWGPKLDGSSTLQFDEISRPYSAKTLAADNFYRTGTTNTNTIAFFGGNDMANYRFSMSNLDNQGIIVNSGLNRKTFSLGTNFKGGKWLVTDVKVSYVKENARNRPNVSDSPGNPNFGTAYLPANVDINDLKSADGEGSDRNGNEQRFNGNDFITNPWFAAYKFKQQTAKDRIIGMGSVRLNLTDWLYLQGRIGEDFFINRTTGVTPTGTAYSAAGNMSEGSLKFSELNMDFLLGIDKQISDNFGLTVNLGGNRSDRRTESLSSSGSSFSVPYLYSLTNLINRNSDYYRTQKRINSLYALAELSFKSQFYLNLTGRNDWYSSLPKDKNSLFYPSVSASWVFSEVLATDWLSFGKIRLAWANAGGDTDPYQTSLNYNIQGNINGVPLGGIRNGSIPSIELQPFLVKELEAGLEMKMFKNRVSLDLAWYNKKTINDIVPVSISGTSGYGAAVVNLGELKNTGVELMLNLTPVKMDKFTWDLGFNLGYNKNEVIKLGPNASDSIIQVDASRTLNAFVNQQVGYEFAQIVAFDYLRDAQGRIVTKDGLPQQGNLITMGSGVHKINGGVNTTLSFGNFSLGLLFDFKLGGKIYSATNAYAYSLGTHKETVNGRENGIVAEGVNEDGTPNTTNVSAEDYYGRLSEISSLFVYDASFIKFRQMTLGWNFPSNWLHNTPFQSINLSLVGRNLALLWKKTQNIDPETNYNNTNAQGLELAGLPTARSFGINLNVKF